MNMHWGDFVAKKTKTHGELVLGVDPVLADIPNTFRKSSTSSIETLRNYTRFLLEITCNKIGFVKFQSAFFEAFGTQGLEILSEGISFAKKHGIGVILDAKRGDIGSTAAAYANAYLTPKENGLGSNLEVDCMTINPFLGPDSLEPFVECARKYGKGLFILTKTSNPGAGWLQDKVIEELTVSDRIASLISAWAEEAKGISGISSIGAVVGATYPEDGMRLRNTMPNSIFLTPGLGPQGGKAEDIEVVRRNDGSGVLVPVSRGITKVGDLSISQENYENLISERIRSFQTSLKNG